IPPSSVLLSSIRVHVPCIHPLPTSPFTTDLAFNRLSPEIRIKEMKLYFQIRGYMGYKRLQTTHEPVQVSVAIAHTMYVTFSFFSEYMLIQ
ncbi:hypothetical protein M8C21_002254, partial [Ambrosia artemisiifolia]